MRPPRVISLGYRCEVAHQIRTRFGDERAMPFDWLITPLSSIPLMVEEEFRHMIDPAWLEPAEVVRRGRVVTTVVNRRYQVLIPHEFPQDAARSLAPDWREHLPQARAKWEFLAERWRSAMATEQPILFVRRGGDVRLPDKALMPTSARGHLEVLAALRSVARDCRLLVVDAGCDLGGTGILTDSLETAGADDVAEDDETWSGPPQAWARVLDRVAPSAAS